MPGRGRVASAQTSGGVVNGQWNGTSGAVAFGEGREASGEALERPALLPVAVVSPKASA
jgi:hypothetical protein